MLTRDPVAALTRSAYGYVANNPLNGTDPSGLFRIPGTPWCIGTCRHHKPKPRTFTCAPSSSRSPYLASYSPGEINCSSGPLASGGLAPGSSAADARNAAENGGYQIPDNHVGEPARNGKGWVFRAPGSSGDANIIRVGEPNSRNPTGYVRCRASGMPYTPLKSEEPDYPWRRAPFAPRDRYRWLVTWIPACADIGRLDDEHPPNSVVPGGDGDQG